MNGFALSVVCVQVHVHVYVCGSTHVLEEEMELTWVSWRERPQSSNSPWGSRAKSPDPHSFVSQLC